MICMKKKFYSKNVFFISFPKNLYLYLCPFTIKWYQSLDLWEKKPIAKKGCQVAATFLESDLPNFQGELSYMGYKDEVLS